MATVAAANPLAAFSVSRAPVVVPQVGLAAVWIGRATWRRPPPFEAPHLWTVGGGPAGVLPSAWRVQPAVPVTLGPAPGRTGTPREDA